MFQLDDQISFRKDLIPETVLIMRDRLYLVPFEEVGLIFEESFPHEHSDTSSGEDESIQIDIEKIDDIFDEESDSEYAESPWEIRPDDISIKHSKCYIKNDKENDRLHGQ